MSLGRPTSIRKTTSNRLICLFESRGHAKRRACCVPPTSRVHPAVILFPASDDRDGAQQYRDTQCGAQTRVASANTQPHRFMLPEVCWSTEHHSVRARAYHETKAVDASLASRAALSVVALFVEAEPGMAKLGEAIAVLHAARRHTRRVVTDAAEAAVRVPGAFLFSWRRAALAVARARHGETNAPDAAAIVGSAGRLVFAEAADVFHALPHDAPSLHARRALPAVTVRRTPFRTACAVDARFLVGTRVSEVVAASRFLRGSRPLASPAAACVRRARNDQEHEHCE